MDDFEAPDGVAFTDRSIGLVESAGSVPSVHYVNEAGVPDSVMREVRENREIASIVERWSQSLRPDAPSATSMDVFGRKKWDGARHIFAQFSMCSWAVENDDILSTLADVTEGLSFRKCAFELFDDSQEDVWNQWAAEFDLDSRLREMFRELFKVSQVYVGVLWGRRDYKVREAPDFGTSDGRPKRRRKTYSLEVPTEMTIFDPTKILPVGTLMFRRERFAYIASRDEDAQFEEALKGNVFDSTVVSLIEGRYTPNASDRAVCEEVGVDHRRLWMLRSGSVFRHTLTRPSYERFSSVRLRPLLPILDMKDNLRSSDRAALAGSSNYLVVITKGTDKLPAKASEIENLREQARVVARVPVLVGDHRLNVEIVSPKLDNTLIESRWQVLDSRLVFAALQSFQPIVQGGNSSGGVSEMSRVVSAGLENRRHMLVRSLERSLFRAILDRNPALSEAPSLSFQPKHITLDFKADVMNAILKLRDRGDISRETTLEELDFDQDVEAQRRSGERRAYDEVFQSGTPYSSPAQNPYGTSPAPISPGRPPGSVGGNDG